MLAVVVVAAIALLQVVELDPNNYVKIYLAGYVLEMNFVVFAVLALLALILSYILLRLFRALLRIPFTYSRWLQRKKVEIADQDLGSGYLSLIKGDWKSAERRLTSHADDSQIPYVSYLAAAQAAQEQGRLKERDEYLSKAYKAAPKERLAIGLTKARLHQAAGQWNMARATLEDIEDIGKRNAQYTAMLMQTHQQAENWQDARALLPTARKLTALPSEVLDEIDATAYTAGLSDAIDMDAAWRALPKAQKQKPDNLVIYLKNLLANQRDAEAEKLIKASLKNNWSDDVLALFGELKAKQPGKARRAAEGWLLAQPKNAIANFVVGKHAVDEGEDDLAKKHLQAAITYGQLPQAYQLLGELFERADDRSKAMQLYKSGLLAAAIDDAATDALALPNELKQSPTQTAD